MVCGFDVNMIIWQVALKFQCNRPGKAENLNGRFRYLLVRHSIQAWVNSRLACIVLSLLFCTCTMNCHTVRVQLQWTVTVMLYVYNELSLSCCTCTMNCHRHAVRVQLQWTVTVMLYVYNYNELSLSLCMFTVIYSELSLSLCGLLFNYIVANLAKCPSQSVYYELSPSLCTFTVNCLKIYYV